jgi:hypothetical protein
VLVQPSKEFWYSIVQGARGAEAGLGFHTKSEFVDDVEVHVRKNATIILKITLYDGEWFLQTSFENQDTNHYKAYSSAFY